MVGARGRLRRWDAAGRVRAAQAQHFAIRLRGSLSRTCSLTVALRVTINATRFKQLTIMAISVGSKAPDFSLKSKKASGLVDVKLSDNFGKKNTVLLFFPLAFTGVCTQEMCDITAGMNAYSS